VIGNPYPKPDHHQKLISFRVSPLAHVYHVLVDVRFRVRELSCSQTHTQTDRQTDRTNHHTWRSYNSTGSLLTITAQQLAVLPETMLADTATVRSLCNAAALWRVTHTPTVLNRFLAVVIRLTQVAQFTFFHSKTILLSNSYDHRMK